MRSTFPFYFSELADKMCPYYLSIGMSAQEYWHGDPELKKFYRQADKLKRQEKNTMLWMQGRYFLDAILCAAPALNPYYKKGAEVHKYPEEPYPLTEKEAKEIERRREEAQMEKAKAMFMAIAQNVKVKGGD